MGIGGNLLFEIFYSCQRSWVGILLVVSVRFFEKGVGKCFRHHRRREAYRGDDIAFMWADIHSRDKVVRYEWSEVEHIKSWLKRERIAS
jgi:hypothetical protein